MVDIIRGRKEIQEVERLLKELIHEYEMFFAGHERVEPIRKRKQVQQLLNKIQSLKLNNMVVKQRYSNLVAKFNTHKRQWANIWLQIEKGIYKREKYRLKKYKKNVEEKEQTKTEEKTEIKERSTPKTANEKDFKKVYNQYITTQKLLNEKVSNINYENMNKKLKIQAEKLKNKYKCKDVNFKVIVKDGKATIRPILVN